MYKMPHEQRFKEDSRQNQCLLLEAQAVQLIAHTGALLLYNKSFAIKSTNDFIGQSNAFSDHMVP